MADLVPFRFHVPVAAFEKALPGGKTSKRIGGLVTTPNKDQQDERVSGDGLDFSEFEDRGWFNDNHGKSTTDVVGLPDAAVRRIKKGQILPDNSGRRAKSDGHWAEGILVGPKGQQVYDLAKDLEGTGRSLGFSIEGQVVERDPLDSTFVAKAKVRNIAVTHCPVNAETELVILSKALTVGSSVNAPSSATPGDGFALRRESLDDEVKYLTFVGLGGKKKRKRLKEDEGVATLKSLFPHMTDDQARWGYQFALRLKAAGALG